MNMEIRPYRDDDEAQVVELWGGTIADTGPHNDPLLAIRLKLQNDYCFEQTLRLLSG
jgi:hypothetical protein